MFPAAAIRSNTINETNLTVTAYVHQVFPVFHLTFPKFRLIAIKHAQVGSSLKLFKPIMTIGIQIKMRVTHMELLLDKFPRPRYVTWCRCQFSNIQKMKAWTPQPHRQFAPSDGVASLMRKEPVVYFVPYILEPYRCSHSRR